MQKYFKIAVLVCFLLGVKPVQAQYGIFINEPAGTFTFNQLWNFNITYSGTTPGLDHYIEIVANEQKEGLLFKVKTNAFKLYATGLNVTFANAGLIGPLNINIIKNTPYADLVYKGGFFPSGKYSFTYNLYKSVVGGGQLVDSYSFETEVESFGTIVLLNVFDKDTIDTYNPTFNWVYSDLQLTDPRIIFKFRLVEVLEKQNPYEAMYFGNAYYEETIKNSTTNLLYPSSARKLQKGKTYAWQVSVSDGQTAITQSEIWTFTIRDDKYTPPPPLWYIEAVENTNTSYVLVSDGVLKIKYFSPVKDKDGKLSFKIINANNKPVLDAEDLNLLVLYGDNRYEIDLTNYKKIKKGLYTFIIEDETGKQKYVRFNYN